MDCSTPQSTDYSFLLSFFVFIGDIDWRRQWRRTLRHFDHLLRPDWPMDFFDFCTKCLLVLSVSAGIFSYFLIDFFGPKLQLNAPSLNVAYNQGQTATLE